MEQEQNPTEGLTQGERQSEEWWDATFAKLKEIETQIFNPAGLIIKQHRFETRFGIKDRKPDRRFGGWERCWFWKLKSIKLSRGRTGKWVEWTPENADAMLRQAVAMLPETEYSRFSQEFRKLIEVKGLDKTWSVYPTEYGIGVWVWCNWNAQRDTALVKSMMDESGIEYSNEYSDARYVYRFRLPKGKLNLEKIRRVLQRAQTKAEVV